MARTGREEPEEGQPDSDSSLPYQVDMTATAEHIYKDLYRKSKMAEELGHPESGHCKTFRIVRDALKNIIPHDPINKAYALRGPLSNIFRLRKGRMRIMWIASSGQRRVCILYISETLRKEGDSSDPYEIFQGLLESGAFDDEIKKLSVRRVLVPVKRK